MLEAFNIFSGTGTILIALLTLSTWALLFLKETTNGYFRFLKKYSFYVAFLFTFIGIAGSLTYANIFNFPPCLYCWWQRIFLYPQFFIIGIGIYLKDRNVWLTSVVLSSIGALISIYHILVQFAILGPSGACETVGVSCAKIDILVFGWITIPMMCLVLFVGIITFMSLGKTE